MSVKTILITCLLLCSATFFTILNAQIQRPDIALQRPLLNNPLTTYTWENEDQSTRGMTKAIIRSDFTFFHGFGSCHPTDCDWKTVPMTRLTGCDDCYRVDYDFGFSKRTLIVERLANNRMRVTSISDYLSASRQDRHDVYFLRRRPANR